MPSSMLVTAIGGTTSVNSQELQLVKFVAGVCPAKQPRHITPFTQTIRVQSLVERFQE